MAPVRRAKLPVAAHDMLAGDVALVGLDQPFAVGGRSMPITARVAIDLGAAVARALGQGLGQVGGLDVAVIGMLDGAENAIGVRTAARFPSPAPGVRTLTLMPIVSATPAVIHELVPAVLRAGEADIRNLLEADVLAGLLLEFL